MQKRCIKCISMVVLFSFIISLFPVGAFAESDDSISPLSTVTSPTYDSSKTFNFPKTGWVGMENYLDIRSDRSISSSLKLPLQKVGLDKADAIIVSESNNNMKAQKQAVFTKLKTSTPINVSSFVYYPNVADRPDNFWDYYWFDMTVNGVQSISLPAYGWNMVNSVTHTGAKEINFSRNYKTQVGVNISGIDVINFIHSYPVNFYGAYKRSGNSIVWHGSGPATVSANKEVNLFNGDKLYTRSDDYYAQTNYATIKSPKINAYINKGNEDVSNPYFINMGVLSSANSKDINVYIDDTGNANFNSTVKPTDGTRNIYMLPGNNPIFNSGDTDGRTAVGDLTGWNLYILGSNREIAKGAFGKYKMDTIGNAKGTFDLHAVSKIGTGAFTSSSKSSGTGLWYDGTKSETNILFGTNLKSIGDNAFKNNLDLKSVVFMRLDNPVPTLGDAIFKDSTKLANIDFNNLQIIGSSMFYNTGLTSITIPDNIKTIKNSAFEANSKLTSVTWNKNVQTAGSRIFAANPNLTTVNIPEGVTNIPEAFVLGCRSLTNINIPNSVTTLGRQAFNGTGIKNLVLPDSVTTLAVGAFNNADNLETISGGSMTEIPRLAYYDANNLKSVMLPDTVTTIGEQAFNKCNSLTNVHLSTSLKSIGTSAFEGCTSLTSLTIPNGVTTIGVDAFKNCTGLTELIIPKSVTVFEGNPFVGIKCPVSVYENSPAKAYCVANSVPYVIVEEIPPQAVSLSPKTDQTISVGDTLQFAASVRPSNATDKTVLWDSSDSSVGTITQDGLFTAIKEGETYVSVTTNTGSKYAEVCVTVTPEVIKEIESIDAKGYQFQYSVNDSFNEAGYLEVKYKDGTSETVPIKQSMVSGFDTSSEARRAITFTYKGFSVIKPYIVYNKIDQLLFYGGIENHFFVGDDFPSSTLKLNVTSNLDYHLDPDMLIGIEPWMVSGFDTSSPTQLTPTKVPRVMTINYAGLSVEANYYVFDSIKSIGNIEGIKPLYDIGAKPEGLTFLAYYPDNFNSRFSITEDMLTGWDTSTPGTKTVTLTFKGQQKTFDINVGKAVKSLELINSKDSFYQTEEFPTDLKAKVTYEDNSSEEVIIAKEMVTGFDTSTSGNFTASISVSGKTINMPYTVVGIDSISRTYDGLTPGSDEFREALSLHPQVSYGRYPDDPSKFEEGYIRVNYADGTKGYKKLSECTVKYDWEESSDMIRNQAKISYKGIGNLAIQYNRNKDAGWPKVKWWSKYPLINNVYEIGEEYKPGNVIAVDNQYYSGFSNTETPEAIRDYMLPDFDTSEPGTYSIPIHIAGTDSLMYTYTVKDKDVSSIEIVSAKDSYLLNEEFDANAKLKINYVDGSSKEIALTEDMLDSFDTSSKGDKTSIINYNDVTKEYKYSVQAEVSSIELISDKINYFINEPFDSNAKLKVTYSDGDVQEIAITEETLTGFSTSTAGNKTLTVTYEGKTTTFDYTVSKVVEESITIEGVTTSYPVNGTFDGYGKVIVHYTDGSTKEIPLLESYMSGFNTTSSGKRLVTVTYNGLSAQYEITVTKILDSIEVSGTKLKYEVNEKFTTQGSLILHYKDGSRDTIDLEESMVSNFDTSTSGSFTATVTYDGKTATFEYNVISNVKLNSISVEDVTTSYTIGAPFDGRGKIIVHYTDGSTEEAALHESNLTGFNTSVAGTRLVTVSYEGLTTQFEIEVVKQVDRITVSDMETEYAINSKFVKQGNVTVYYKDGTQDTISLDESMVSNFDTSTAGKHTVTVTYAGKTTTYKINVGESTPVSITANWDGKKTIQVDATGKFSHITLPNGNSFYKPSFIWPVLSSGVYDFTIHGQDGTSVDSDMVVVSDWDVTPPIISFSSTYKTDDPVTVTVIDSESGFDRCIAPDGTEYTTSTFAYTPGMYGTFVAYDKAGNMAAKDFNVLDVQIGGGSSTTYVALEGIPNAWTNQDVVLKVGALNDEEGVISIEANGSNIDNSEVEFSPNEDVIASDEKPIDERTDSPVSDEESDESEEEVNVPNNETENKDDIVDKADKDLTGSDIESKPESDMGSEPGSDTESEEEAVEPDQNTAEEEIVPDNNTEESVLTAISTITRYLVDGPMLLDAISKSPVVNTLTVVDNGPISFTVITPSGEYEDSVVVERIDKVAPELTLTLRENNVLSVVATDDLSGLKYIDIEGINSYNFNTDGTLISGFDVFVPANGTITVAVTDYAGNITTQTVDITYDTSNPPEEPNITPVDPSNPPNGDESGSSGNGDSGDTPGGDDESGGTAPDPDGGNDNDDVTPPDDGSNDDVTPPDDGSNDDVTPPDNDSSDDNNGNNGSSSGGGGGTSSNTGTSPDNVNKGESASDIGGIDKDNKPYVLHAGIKINGTVGKGYISGYEDRTFRPTNNLTRQEFASIIDRIITFETEANELLTPFTDTQGSWGEGSINHLAQHNLIAGVEGNKFEPNRNITRAEAVVILSRIVDFSEYPSTSKLQGLSEWQQKSMIAQALNAGLVSNYDEETYDINKNITRAEVVNIINNIVFSNKLSNKRNIFTDISDRDSWYEDVVKATDEKMLEMYK